jgi:hypothetical protein
LASPISEATIREAAYEIDGAEPIYFWDLKACQAFWIDRAGNVIDSVKSHHWFADQISVMLKSIGRRPHLYFMREARWVRGRMYCDNLTDPSKPGARAYAGFEIMGAPSRAQRKTMQEMVGHFSDRDFVLDAEGGRHFQAQEIERYLGC